VNTNPVRVLTTVDKRPIIDGSKNGNVMPLNQRILWLNY